MLDEFAFLGEDLARKLVIENTNVLAEIFEPVEVVKGDLYTPFIDKAEETGAELTYTLVSDTEANLKEKKISVNTPIAKGLMGRKVGDVVEVQTPGGLLNFEILNISI